jgi:RNA polymerase sigma-70 factor (ECF subfamily)
MMPDTMGGRPVPAASAAARSAPRLDDLVARTTRGDPQALAALFETYGPLVHRTALCLTLSADDADDVVQDVFIGLPEALARYVDRGAFEPWLRTVTSRVALMKMRLTRRHDAAHASIHPEPADPRADHIAERLSVLDALGRLSEEQRIVFLLKVVEGYTHEEIARQLGIRRGTSEVRLFRAIRQLRELLGRD